MLLRELLQEHGGWALDKGLELDFALALEAASSGKPLETDKLSEKGSKIKAILEKIANDLVGSSTVNIIGKPSGSKPTYGSGSEPKSDLNVVIGKKTYAFSVKAGAAYAMSAGSKSEYHGICAASISLFEELYPKLASETKDKIIVNLIPIAETIGKSRKTSDYTSKGLKNKKEGWFERGFDKQPAKSITADERSSVDALRADAEKIIDDDNAQQKGKYKAMLAKMEGIAKSGIKDAFETEEFARCFIWEISSGVKKFHGLSEIRAFSNPKAAYANTIVYLNGKGVFDLSSQNSEYVTMSLKSHSVRLQNVPRGWIMTYMKAIRGGANPSPQLLADALREIELSLKIGVGPGATGKIKESQLNEFATDNALVKNLVAVLKTASLASLCNAFGIAATLV